MIREVRRDPRLAVRVVGRRSLVYAEGPDPAEDRPAHVRAASGVLAIGRGHLVIQDDALFLGQVDAAVRAVSLPASDGVRLFGGDRPNKAHKPDLEAATPWHGPSGRAILAFGSGSTPRRERVLVVQLTPDDAVADLRWVDAPALYAAVRAALPPCALNLEGAWQTPDGGLRLLQRGNGAGGVNAAIDIDGAWAASLLSGPLAPARVAGVTRWDLGALDGVPLTFTDGTPRAGQAWLFAAAAEASPDTYHDGAVTGSVLGWVDGDEAGWAPVTDEAGAPLPCKLEGIATDGHHLVGVVDPDDPTAPAELLALQLVGPWPRAVPGRHRSD